MIKTPKEIFRSFENINVLIIGDVMIDNYLTGKVSRVSPEAPVPIVDWNNEENRLGGAANVALNIQALGAKPYLCSVIGKDQDSEIFRNLLVEKKLLDKGIISSATRRTTTKTRVIAQGQHLLRIDKEERRELDKQESKNIIDAFLKILDSTPIQVILFQDYNKGVLTEEIIKTVLIEAYKRKIPTVVDPKFNNFWSYKNVTLFKPNLKEIQDALNNPIEINETSLKNAADYIKEKLGNNSSIITLSDKGLYVFDGTEGQILPTFPRKIADVCGAGDTVISICALGIAISLDLYNIGLLANLAGGQVCEKVGVVQVDRNILQEEFASALTNQN